MKKTLLAVVAIILIVIVASSAWYVSQRGPPPPVAQKNVLTIGTTTTYTTFDPPLIYGGASPYPAVQIFETLFRFDSHTGELLPSLAESYEHPDGVTWIIHLRKNVKFHDDTLFNATAVKFSIDRVVQKKGPWYGEFAAYYKSVEVIDEYTVKFVTKMPYLGFLKTLTMPSTSAVSPTSVSKLGADFCVKGAAGTGPWKFVSWTPGVELILEKNNNYWDPTRSARVDQLVLKQFRDASTLAMAIETGSIDVAYRFINPEDYARLTANPHLKYSVGQQEFAKYTVFGVDAWPPLKNPLVRQAIFYAIDYDRLVAVAPSVRVYNGFTKGDFAQALENKTYSYSPQKAKALLAAAGFPNGFKGGTYYYMPEFGSHEVSYATIIQSNLRDVGIEMNIQSGDWASVRVLAMKQGVPMYMSRYSADVPDPDASIRGLYSKDGYILTRVSADLGYVDKVASFNFTDAINKALIEQDPAKRIAMYQEIQSKFESTNVLNWYVREQEYLFYRDNIKGAYLSPISIMWLTASTWWEIEKTPTASAPGSAGIANAPIFAVMFDSSSRYKSFRIEA